MIKLKQLIKEGLDDKEITTDKGSIKYIKQGDTARIWDVRAVVPKSGFFTSALLQLKKEGIKTIIINLQSSNMREALIRLVKSNKLLNPRNMIGISVDEHPSTFDLNETMFPKEFNRHSLGSCMSAAELSTTYLKSKGITDFKIVEGFVSMYPEQESKDWSPHTWIEFKNGKIFDPTKKQWANWGFNPKETEYKKIVRRFTPEQYIKLCKIHPNHWEDFKKSDSITENILQEGERIYGWWIDSSGKGYSVPYQNHSEWAIEYLKQKNVLNPGVMVYKKMYSLGFIRAIKEVYNGWGIFYEYEQHRPPNSRQIKSLKDLAIENDCKYIWDDITRKSISVGDDYSNLIENMTYKELLGLTTPERTERSKDVRVRSIPVTIENGQEQWRFRYKSSPISTVTNKPFEGHITFFKESVKSSQNAMDLDCKVDCNCPDYMYKFAYNNMQQDAGDIGKDSLNKCANRPPQPAYNIGEGLCKHLAALRGYLQTKITSTKKSNLFEAINDVANQGTFNIECDS